MTVPSEYTGSAVDLPEAVQEPPLDVVQACLSWPSVSYVKHCRSVIPPPSVSATVRTLPEAS